MGISHTKKGQEQRWPNIVNGEGQETSFFMLPIPHNKADYNVRRNNYYAPLLQRGNEYLHVR